MTLIHYLLGGLVLSGLAYFLRDYILFVAAAVWLVFKRSKEYLERKVYTGRTSRQLGVLFIGFCFSAVVALSTTHYLSADLGWSIWLWFPSVAIAFVLSMTHLWPVLYWYFFRHIWNLVERVLDGVSFVAKNVVKPLCENFLRLVRFLPFADAIWAATGDRTNADGQVVYRRRWGLTFLASLLGLLVISASAYAGLFVFQSSAGVFTIPVLAALHMQEAVAGIFAVTVAYLVGMSLYHVVDQGDKAFAAIVYSAGSLYGLFAYTNLFVALPVATASGIAAGLFVVGVGYVFPAIVLILNGGLVERIFRGWERLLNAVYSSEPNRAFRLFFHHVMNIVLALTLGYIVFDMLAALSLPGSLPYVLAFITASFFYVEESHDFLDKDVGNAFIGLVLSLIGGLFAYHNLPLYFDLSWTVLSLLVAASVLGVGFLVFPLAYLLVFALTSWMAPTAGPVLASVHSGINKSFTVVREAIRELHRKAFSDVSPFAVMFGHLLNVSVVAVAIWQSQPYVAPYLDSYFWVVAFVVAIVGVNVLVLLGRLFSRAGAETLSVAAFLTVGYFVGNLVFASTANWTGAIVVAVVPALAAGGLIAPLFYLGAKSFCDLLVTSWLAPVVNGAFDYIWEQYKAAWIVIGRRFSYMVGFVMVLVKPAIEAAERAWAAAQRVLSRMGF